MKKFFFISILLVSSKLLAQSSSVDYYYEQDRHFSQMKKWEKIGEPPLGIRIYTHRKQDTYTVLSISLFGEDDDTIGKTISLITTSITPDNKRNNNCSLILDNGEILYTGDATVGIDAEILYDIYSFNHSSLLINCVLPLFLSTKNDISKWNYNSKHKYIANQLKTYNIIKIKVNDHTFNIDINKLQTSAIFHEMFIKLAENTNSSLLY